MTTVQQNHVQPRPSWAKEFYPRCSTPISDPRILYAPEKFVGFKKRVEGRGEYWEWRKRLGRKPSSNQFKVRGPGDFPKSCGSEDCSMISGYVKLTLEDRKSEETTTRPAASPIYHPMWPPMSHPTFWSPTTPPHTCHHQNPLWYQLPAQHFQPLPVPGPSGGAPVCNILNDAHHHHHHHHHRHNHDHNFHYEVQHHDHCIAGFQLVHYNTHFPLPIAPPQMAVGHVCNQHQFPAPTPFLTYLTETRRTPTYVNVPIHEGNGFPIMMTSQ